MQTAVGALALLLSLSGGALFSRWYVTPSGAHRAPRTRPAAVLADEAGESTEWEWCPTERTRVRHTLRESGALECDVCGRVTTGAM